MDKDPNVTFELRAMTGDEDPMICLADKVGHAIRKRLPEDVTYFLLLVRHTEDGMVEGRIVYNADRPSVVDGLERFIAHVEKEERPH
jgi:hypothetical protein